MKKWRGSAIGDKRLDLVTGEDTGDDAGDEKIEGRVLVGWSEESNSEVSSIVGAREESGELLYSCSEV